MKTSVPPNREECIEQVYFFRTLRERLAENMAAQDILARIDEEILSTTKLPFAVQFLASELKHSGLLASGFSKLPHYFTPFQSFVVKQAELDDMKLTMPVAMLILEREAAYKADVPTPSGLFVYQFETIARNRLGYDEGLNAVANDPFYDVDWSAFAEFVRRQVGIVEFSDLVYLRSHQYVNEQKRTDANYAPSVPPLFEEREGKIGKASRGRDPMFLFSALQRQLNYPEVPKPVRRDDKSVKIEQIATTIRDLETRIRMLESEARGTFDPTQFAKPELLDDD